MVRVGVDSIPVVFLTTMFTGMVMALQTYSGFQRVHAENFVASVVSLAMVRELSPVLVGLMVAGRVGSSMAAEIGTMRVTEQIDALESLATNPVHYLFVPRVLAGIIMLPFLVILGDGIGIFGGYLIGVKLMGANPVVYDQNTWIIPRVDGHLERAGQSGRLRADAHVDGMREGLLHHGRRRGRRARDDERRGRRLSDHPAERFLPDEDPLLMRRTAARYTDEVLISIRDLHKSFRSKEVLKGLSLDVHRGESVVIVGGSGTGKSVTLRHIIGLIRPDSGDVLIEGRPLGDMGPRELNDIRRKFGMSFQEGALFDSMNVFENIAFPLRRHTKMTEKEIRARVLECLEEVHLYGVESRRPSELSGGMRRRVGFARAISLKPEILLFDEPTTGLDPVISDVVADLIVEMDEKLGVTAVTITHDMKIAFKIADKIAMICGGRIIEEGTPEAFEAVQESLRAPVPRGARRGPAHE